MITKTMVKILRDCQGEEMPIPMKNRYPRLAEAKEAGMDHLIIVRGQLAHDQEDLESAEQMLRMDEAEIEKVEKGERVIALLDLAELDQRIKRTQKRIIDLKDRIGTAKEVLNGISFDD